MSVNSRLNAIQIIDQMKAFHRQRIPGSGCARKETVDIDILVTFRNGERKIKRSIRITNRPPLSQFRSPSTKVIPIERLLLSWLYFDDELRVQEKQQVKDQQSCISIFVAYPTIPSSNQEHQPRHNISIPCMAVWLIYKDTKQPQEKETSQNESRFQFSWRLFQQYR